MPQGPGRVTSGDMGGYSDLGSALNRQLGSGLRGVGQGTPESNRQRQASLIHGGRPSERDTADDNSMQIIQLLLRALGSQAQPIQPPPDRGLEIGPEMAPQEALPDATAQAQVSKLFR